MPLPPATYLSDIDATPLLTADREHELAVRVAAGDTTARDHMVRANLRLVVSIARQYAGKTVPLDDLISEGNLGLLRAVEGFDPAAGTRLSTYAAWWIKQSIRKSFQPAGRVARLPAYVVRLVTKWRLAAAALQYDLGRAPTDAEVVARLGLTPKLARVAQKALGVNGSGPAEGDAGWGESQADGRAEQPGDAMADAEVRAAAMRSLDRLGDRAAAVLRLRFGLNGGAPMTLRQVGERVGLTRERIRQIEGEALVTLRASLAV